MWQAGFICTLVGLPSTIQKNFDRKTAIADLAKLFSVKNSDFALAV